MKIPIYFFVRFCANTFFTRCFVVCAPNASCPSTLGRLIAKCNKLSEYCALCSLSQSRRTYSSQLSANPFLITLYNWSPLVYQVSLNPLVNLMWIRLTVCASSVLSFFFSSSSCAISNAGYRVSSRRVSLSS